VCEFKIIRENDGSQIGEEILVLSYTEDNELIIKDVLGMGDKLESALILDVNTMNQKCTIIEHPLIKDFIGLMRKLTKREADKEDIEKFQRTLETFKNSI